MPKTIIANARMQAKGLHVQGCSVAGQTMLDLAATLQSTSTQKDDLADSLSDLLTVAKAYQEWIKAVPDEVAASLPAMPGIDGDWADEVMYKAKSLVSKDGSKPE